MALREVRELLLLSFLMKRLDETELLCDLNSSRNPDFPYWKYNGFNLQSLKCCRSLRMKMMKLMKSRLQLSDINMYLGFLPSCTCAVVQNNEFIVLDAFVLDFLSSLL